MTRRRPLLLFGSVAVAFASIGTPPVQSVEAPVAGWWWRAQTGAVTDVPPPPTVPAGGLSVSGTPQGATALAAVRYVLDPGETDPILTLRVAHQVGGAAAIVGACPAGSAWLPASGGRWDTAPTAACDLGSVNGIPSPDVGQFTFPVASLVVDGVLDIVLVPGTVAGGAPGANGSSFQIDFHPPDVSSLVTTRGAVDEPTADAAFSYEPSVVTSSPDTYLPSDVVTAAPFAPSLAPEQQVVTPSAPINQRVAAAQLPRPPREAGGNLLGFLVAAAGLYAAFRLSRETAPPVRRLGPMAHRAVPVVLPVEAAEPAGLGRFARPRVGPPPRLH